MRDAPGMRHGVVMANRTWWWWCGDLATNRRTLSFRLTWRWGVYIQYILYDDSYMYLFIQEKSSQHNNTKHDDDDDDVQRHWARGIEIERFDTPANCNGSKYILQRQQHTKTHSSIIQACRLERNVGDSKTRGRKVKSFVGRGVTARHQKSVSQPQPQPPVSASHRQVNRNDESHSTHTTKHH